MPGHKTDELLSGVSSGPDHRNSIHRKEYLYMFMRHCQPMDRNQQYKLLYTDDQLRIDMKTRRLSAIRDVIDREPVHSQEELRQHLAGLGFVVTQATLSRDIKELGLVKRASDGAYQTAALPERGSTAAAVVSLSRALGEFLLGLDVAQQLVVVKTGPGQAQLLGLAIDRARLTEVIGTIAGDDTILVVCRDQRAAQVARNTLEHLASEA